MKNWSLIAAAAAFIYVSGAPLSPLMAQTDGLQTLAPHAVIMDRKSGIILYEKDARLPMEPASMTKIMTAALVFDRIRDGSITLDTEFIVSENAWRRGGSASGSSTMFLELGSSVRVGDLIKGVIIQSGNDACIVLAEGIAGSETAFADMMTKRAREIGLSTANFKNSTGWPDPEHVISAYDLAKLAEYTIREYPEFHGLYSETSFEWNKHKQPNRNPLLGKVAGADGLKTGHTESAKYGLVGSAVRGEEGRILVVNGIETNALRAAESIRLMQAAFDAFKVYTLYSAGAEVERAPVFMGKSPDVALVTVDDVKIGMQRALRSGLKARVELSSPVPAPIVKGQPMGELIVSLPGRDDQRFALVAGADVARKGFFGRILTKLGGK